MTNFNFFLQASIKNSNNIQFHFLIICGFFQFLLDNKYNITAVTSRNKRIKC